MGFDTIKGRNIHMAKTHARPPSRTPTRTARAPPTAAYRDDARPLRLMLQGGSGGGAAAAGEQGDCEPPDAAGYETEESEKPGEFLLEFTDISQDSSCFLHVFADYRPDEGKMPKLSEIQARFLRLVTDLHLSNRDADAISK
jgi:hypothetical protein